MDVFASIDEEPGHWRSWLMLLVETKSATCLIFSEYVLLVCMFGVMSKLEILRFIFGTLDTERSSYITQASFDEMCDVLMEFEKVCGVREGSNSPFPFPQTIPDPCP